jgi:hypothetical protein
MFAFTPVTPPGQSPSGEPRGRSFGQVRRDVLLQIDPSAFDASAGYISTTGSAAGGVRYLPPASFA